MQTGDMEIIKDIPGYNVILKAVLKGQIQYLVEQLVNHTGEESVILTASVSDGSLSHLGSESGKVFLQDHDDIKAQFLGFCLKRHHRQKQLEAQQTSFGTGERRSNPLSAARLTSPKSRYQNTPPLLGMEDSKFTSPIVHPETLTHTQPRMATGRHKPYSAKRPSKVSLNVGIRPKSYQSAKSSSETKSIEQIHINPNEVIKIEAADQDDSLLSESKSENSTASNDYALQNTDPSQIQSAVVSLPSDNNIPPTSDNEQIHASCTNYKLETSDAAISESSEVNLSESQANFNSDSMGSASNEVSDVGEKPTVKLEPVSEAEVDLEIIGVEPGVMIQGQGHFSEGENNWMPDVQNRIGTSASASAVDGQYNGWPSKQRQEKSHHCSLCGKFFKWLPDLRRHHLTHTGERPYSCEFCGRQFSRKDALRRHHIIHM